MTTDLPMRDFDELIMFYSLHPDEQDILVEGAVDRAIVSWFLRCHNRSVNVYQLNKRVTSVPAERLAAIGVSTGLKNELLATAYAIDQACPGSATIVVVDADRECSVESPPDRSSRVVATDFTSMECYCLDVRVLTKLLRLVLGLPEERVNAHIFAASIEDAMRTLFVVRWVLSSLDPPRRMVKNRRRRMSYSTNSVRVDANKLLLDSTEGFRTPEPKEKLREFGELAAVHKLPLVAHGHDIADVIGFWIGKELSRTELAGKHDLKKAENVRSALIGCLESAQLIEYRLFEELLSRTA